MTGLEVATAVAVAVAVTGLVYMVGDSVLAGRRDRRDAVARRDFDRHTRTALQQANPADDTVELPPLSPLRAVR